MSFIAVLEEIQFKALLEYLQYLTRQVKASTFNYGRGSLCFLEFVNTIKRGACEYYQYQWNSCLFFPFESTLIILKFCFGLLNSFVSFDLFMEVKSMVVKRAPP